MSNDSRKVLWTGPPPPPDPNAVVEDLSCQGIVGMALQEALESLRTEIEIIERPERKQRAVPSKDETNKWEQSNEMDHIDRKHVIDMFDSIRATKSNFLQQESIDRIMHTFGESVAQSHVIESDNFNNRTVDAASSGSGSPDRPQLKGPSVLLRGRLDHYNKLSSKWRILVRDAEIVERKEIDSNRRSREKPSLWKVMSEDGEEQETTEAPTSNLGRSKVWKLPGPLEILAYNDL